MPTEADIAHARDALRGALADKGVSGENARAIADAAARNAERRERAREEDRKAGRPIGTTVPAGVPLPTHLLRRG